jgi:DNA-directed RNA polymerase subunit L
MNDKIEKEIPTIDQVTLPFGNYSKIYKEGDLTVAIDQKFLEKETKKINQKASIHFSLQNLNAVACLKQSLIEICKFKEVYLTIIAKGDDKTIINNIKYCINQCEQARECQYPSSYNLNSLIYLDISNFQIYINEIMEQFITLLKTILKCIGYNFDSSDFSSSSSIIEYVAQTHSWIGWSQNGHMALLSYNCLMNILGTVSDEKFSEKETKIMEDIKNIVNGFDYIIKSYISGKYPSADKLLDFFNEDIIINKDSLKLLKVDKKTEKVQSKKWNLGGLWG